MPTTRKSASRTGPPKGQSTLSFHHKVSKNVSRDTTKKVAISRAVTKVESPPAEVQVNDVVIRDVETNEPREERIEAPEKAEIESEAESITSAQIGKFWTSIEKQRIAPRVHQQGLDSSEKVLRYFDVSSQYGPCIGTSRLSRWKRAERLGLHPPIEVLAVLLKEESKGNMDSRMAHMDKIMNSTAAGAGI